MSSTTLRDALRAQIDEEAELAAALLALIPPGTADWRPPWPASPSGDLPLTLGQLAEHLSLTLSGFCAVLAALHPEPLRHFESLRGIQDFQRLRRHILEGFAIATDAGLAQTLPSMFQPEGQNVLELFLVNLRHLSAHKFQLFIYLKILGVPVSSRHLYRFRG